MASGGRFRADAVPLRYRLIETNSEATLYTTN
jgi:hypothetical protein